jgi:hypothetical protein
MPEIKSKAGVPGDGGLPVLTEEAPGSCARARLRRRIGRSEPL